MKYVFIKEKITESGKQFSAFTALSDVLKSEGLFNRYKEIWKAIHEQEINNKLTIAKIWIPEAILIIRKLKLNKSKYGKK